MYSNLCDLIDILKDNSKLQIGIISFSTQCINSLILPRSHTIHTAPICNKFKSKLEKEYECMNCRNKAIKKMLKIKEPYYGMCINGIWEYMYPLEIDQKIVGIIFIGNILRSISKDRIVQKLHENGWEKETDILLETMSTDMTEEKCKKYAELIDSYYHLIYQQYKAKCKTIITTPLMDLKNFIDENYNGNINIHDLAETFHYNEKYLGRCFKRLTGYSIKNYICIKRIEDAMTMLKETDISISEIAINTGFETIPYFNKRFRDYVKMTP